MLAMGAPGRLWLAGERSEPARALEKNYQAGNSSTRLTLFDGTGEATTTAAVSFLTRNPAR
jgi:hypothetical protein